MDDATYEKMRAAKKDYHPEAMRIPGVHGTSIGLKAVADDLTKTLAICIHLTEKKPLSEVPEEERIPKEIGGFPTDVIEHDQLEPQADGSKRRPVLGGIQIAVGSHHGTLGCIVRDKSDGKLCLLSNQHVLVDKSYKVFQPKRDPVCDQIGTTKRVVLSALVDGGISSLVGYGGEKTGEEAKIVDIGDVQGSYSVTVNDLPYPAKKRGRTTLLTFGNVVGIAYDGIRTDGWIFTDQMFIQNSDPNLPFVAPGDSGSALVSDAENLVVGLVWGGNAEGSVGAASQIREVLRELDIEVVMAGDRMAARTPYSETMPGKLEALLRQSDRGVDYWKAFLRYRSRVMHMFHETPRLYATWLKTPRNALARTVLDAISDPNSEIPATIGGRNTAEVLGKLHRELSRYVDRDDLQQAMDSLYDDVTSNIGASWKEALSDDTADQPVCREAALTEA